MAWTGFTDLRIVMVVSIMISEFPIGSPSRSQYGSLRHGSKLKAKQDFTHLSVRTQIRQRHAGTTPIPARDVSQRSTQQSANDGRKTDNAR